MSRRGFRRRRAGKILYTDASGSIGVSSAGHLGHGRALWVSWRNIDSGEGMGLYVVPLPGKRHRRWVVRRWISGEVAEGTEATGYDTHQKGCGAAAELIRALAAAHSLGARVGPLEREGG